jgi:hypothetical protein
MIRSLFIVALFAAVALTTGCPPPPNYLDGSIKTSHDLAFDTVELRFLSEQSVYELTYYKNLGETADEGRDEVVEIAFTQAPGDIVAETPIDITTAEAASQVERTTAANDPFPPDLETATVTFFVAPVVGETVNGEFAVLFTNGRTLNGGFEAELAEASF